MGYLNVFEILRFYTLCKSNIDIGKPLDIRNTLNSRLFGNDLLQPISSICKRGWVKGMSQCMTQTYRYSRGEFLLLLPCPGGSDPPGCGWFPAGIGEENGILQGTSKRKLMKNKVLTLL